MPHHSIFLRANLALGLKIAFKYVLETENDVQ